MLESGLIEVVYYTGARVVIEGPADFTVGPRNVAETDSDGDVKNSGYLKLGRLFAQVEGEDAQGFFVDTPTARVEDLGTEFGVEVDGAGDTLLEVIRGKVELHKTDADGHSYASMRLSTGSAARVSPDSKGIVSVPSTKQFVTTVPRPIIRPPSNSHDPRKPDDGNSSTHPYEGVTLPSDTILVDASGWVTTPWNRLPGPNHGLFSRWRDLETQLPCGTEAVRLVAIAPFNNKSKTATLTFEIDAIDSAGTKFAFDLVVRAPGLAEKDCCRQGQLPGAVLKGGEIVTWTIRNIKPIKIPEGKSIAFLGFTAVGIHNANRADVAGQVRNAATRKIVGAFDNQSDRNIRLHGRHNRIGTLPLLGKPVSIDITPAIPDRKLNLLGFLAEFRVVGELSAPQEDTSDPEAGDE